MTIEIPNNATNGEVISMLFPDEKINMLKYNISYEKWWNSPYKADKEDD